MKRLFIAVMIGIIGLVAKSQSMNDGHKLTELWKKYDAAVKADLPRKRAQILEEIKKEAQTKHLPVDFYDAATTYVSVVQSRDWKQSAQLRENLKKEVEAFNEPIVTFRWMDSWEGHSQGLLRSYVEAHPDGFNGRTRPFYDNVGHYLGGVLPDFITSDKEYVLWRIKDNDALRALIAGRYPNEAALDLSLAHKKEELEAVAEKYEGKAASLYPRSQILDLDYSEANRNNAGEDTYKALFERARQLEAERKAYKGDEALIAKGCTYPSSLMESLSSKNLRVELNQRKVSVLFTNLDKADVRLLRDDKEIKRWKAVNPRGSFHVTDTISIDLPELPDGEYIVEATSGKLSDQAPYSQYTLSIASRTDALGRCVYVADFESGKPLDKVELALMTGDKEVARTSMALKGFTPLPKAFSDNIDKASSRTYFSIVAYSGDRKSMPVSIRRGYDPTRYDERVRCNIFKDRGAYNPGDSLKFKAIVFEGNPSLSLKLCKGREVEMILHDSEDNVIAREKLTTNEWGSVSGSFLIPVGLRNGYFELEAKGLAYDRFRVDEFILPSFDADFDPLDKLYFQGDTIKVSGKLNSYSGHNLTGAKLEMDVTYYGTLKLAGKELELQDGNRFCGEFPAEAKGYYSIGVKVSLPDGETRSFYTSCFVSDGFSVSADVISPSDSNYSLNVQKRKGTTYVIESQKLDFELTARDYNYNKVPGTIKYTISSADGTLLETKEASSGDIVSYNLPGSGLYYIFCESKALKADGTEVKADCTCTVLCLLPVSKAIPEGVERIFIPGDMSIPASSVINFRIGSGEGTIYAVVTLYGKDREQLYNSQMVIPSGVMENVSIPYKTSYPDAVRLQVFYFINSTTVSYDNEYRRKKDRYTLPLSFTRFTDSAYPGSEVSFRVKTAPDVEMLAAAWDKSLDAVAQNNWPVVSLYDVSAPYVNLQYSSGRITSSKPWVMVRGMASTKANGAVMEDAMMVNEAIPFQMVEEKASFGAEPEQVRIREDFASALTFQPHLRPGADGNLDVKFRTSDKLSTFYVRVYAHDAALRNATVQKELLVTLPVKLTLQEPAFLYEGDEYDAVVAVSNTDKAAVSGVLSLRAGDFYEEKPLEIAAGGTSSQLFSIKLPSGVSAGEKLEITATFASASFSDAVRVNVPLLPAYQQILEAHSAVLRDGMDREALLEELRSRFVNAPASEASLKDISVLDMVKELLSSKVEPSGNDVLSLSEALYSREVIALLGGAPEPTAELLEKILSCRNSDGGFGWFEGMSSSPAITAVLLERFAKLRDKGLPAPALESSVKYLDRIQFGATRPLWYGGISDAQYMHVRAMYAQVPFEVSTATSAAKKRLQQFRKDAKSYLVPSAKEGRSLQGQILAKARRILTLRNLLEIPGGIQLAKDWGVSLGASARLKKSVKADEASLIEYAVEHRDGGRYYPNAVMPWRGLLESEAYAHSLISDLLVSTSPEIADGIRLWLMLQKETQSWPSDPAFVDAVNSVLAGSDAVLNTRVLALSSSARLPFASVKASGNGFSIERKFFIGDKEIFPGDSLSVGDKIVAKYVIWNGENRSFVRLAAPREASLVPVRQLSGHTGSGFIVPRFGGAVWSYMPQGYRNVKAACTEYYFDTYPEENTTISEEFYVTRAGVFQAPAVSIESLYATHYRANASAPAPLRSVR